MSSCSSTICRKDHLFSIILPLLLCQISVDCIYVWLIPVFRIPSLQISKRLFLWVFAQISPSQWDSHQPPKLKWQLPAPCPCASMLFLLLFACTHSTWKIPHLLMYLPISCSVYCPFPLLKIWHKYGGFCVVCCMFSIDPKYLDWCLVHGRQWKNYLSSEWMS